MQPSAVRFLQDGWGRVARSAAHLSTVARQEVQSRWPEEHW